jgi:MFS family permease
MTLALRGTIRAGVARASTRNGLVLVVAFLVVSLLQIGLIWLVSTTYLPLGSGTPVMDTTRAGPTPGTSPSALVASASVVLVSVTGGILTVPVQIVAIRTMVSNHTERIPEEFVFHNMGWALLHTFFGSFIVSILVGGLALGGLALGGFLLFFVIGHSTQMWLIGHWFGWLGIGLLVFVLLLPSAFLALSLLFVSHEVSVKDKNVFKAITGSWQYCRGNRFRLLVLVLVTFLLSGGVSVILNLGLRVVAGLDPVLIQVIVIITMSIVQIVILTIMARAYVAVNDDSLTLVAGDSQLSD